MRSVINRILLDSIKLHLLCDGTISCLVYRQNIYWGYEALFIEHYSIYIGIDFYICFYLFFRLFSVGMPIIKCITFLMTSIFFCLYDYMCLTHLHEQYIHTHEHTSKC